MFHHEGILSTSGVTICVMTGTPTVAGATAKNAVVPTICQQLLRGYNPATKFQLNVIRRVHVLGNLDQKSVGL